MKKIVYIAYITMIQFLRSCSSECTHYYLMLKETYDDDLNLMIDPITISTITSNYASFNNTEEVKKLHDNRECVLELKTPVDCSIINCFNRVKTTNKYGIDEHGLSLPTTKPTTTTTLAPETTPPKLETTTPIPETTTPDLENSTPDIESSTPCLENTTPDLESTTSDLESTPPDLESTTPEIETTTHVKSLLAAKLLARDKRMEIAKAVSIAVLGIVSSSALAYFVAVKIKHMLQYGAYHLTDSNPTQV